MEKVLKSPLNNPYHLKKEQENMEANLNKQPMSQEDFIKQSQMLKMNLSAKKQITKN